LIEGYELRGSPTPEEEAAILEILGRMLRDERDAVRPSAWKEAGRALALRSGILDFRTRLPGPAWRYSSLPWIGRPHSGRDGRGDAK
jgi:hypothetical protein